MHYKMNTQTHFPNLSGSGESKYARWWNLLNILKGPWKKEEKLRETGELKKNRESEGEAGAGGEGASMLKISHSSQSLIEKLQF